MPFALPLPAVFGSGAAESPISHLGRTPAAAAAAARVKPILKLPRLVDTKNAVL